MLRSSDTPDLAQKAVTFLLSREAQQYLVDQSGEYPTVAGVSRAQKNPPLPALSTLSGPPVDLAGLGSVPQTEALLQQTGLL